MEEPQETTDEPKRLTFRQTATAQGRKKAGLWIAGIFDSTDAFGELKFQLLPETDPRVKAAFDDGVKNQCATAANGAVEEGKVRNYHQLDVEHQRAVIRWQLATAIRNVSGTVRGWPDPEAPDDPERDVDLVFAGTPETASESKAQWGEVMRSPGFPVRVLYALQKEVTLQSADTAKRDLEIVTMGEGCAFGSLSSVALSPTGGTPGLRDLVGLLTGG